MRDAHKRTICTQTHNMRTNAQYSQQYELQSPAKLQSPRKRYGTRYGIGRHNGGEAGIFEEKEGWCVGGFSNSINTSMTKNELLNNPRTLPNAARNPSPSQTIKNTFLWLVLHCRIGTCSLCFVSNGRKGDSSFSLMLSLWLITSAKACEYYC